MAETATKLPVRNESGAAGSMPAPQTTEWPMFANLRREMDRLFDDFGRDWFRAPTLFRDFDRMPRWSAALDLTPAVDVVENGKGWRITAELPGLDDKTVDVSIAGNVLTLKGEKTETKDEDQKGTHVSERRYGSFQRAFTLPDGIDRDHIEATFANGILTVMLPKAEAAKVEETKIEVKAA